MIKVKTLTSWATVRDLARCSSGKNSLDSEVTDKFKKSLLRNRHSPLRGYIFEIYLEGFPRWLLLELKTHTIGCTWVMKSSREDITGRDRGLQTEPSSLRGIVNAEALLNMFGLRLCQKAHPQMIKLMEDLRDKIYHLDQELWYWLHPRCVGMYECPEGLSSKCIIGQSSQRFKEFTDGRL